MNWAWVLLGFLLWAVGYVATMAAFTFHVERRGQEADFVTLAARSAGWPLFLPMFVLGVFGAWLGSVLAEDRGPASKGPR